jgi:hypothetical protein
MVMYFETKHEDVTELLGLLVHVDVGDVTIHTIRFRGMCRLRLQGQSVYVGEFLYILSRFYSDYRWVMDWILDLLTTYTYHLELHFTDH